MAELADLDDIHAAWLAGWTEGYAQGRRASVGEMAHALLHEQAAAMAGAAVRTARERHGQQWAVEIQRQADGS